MLTNETVRRLDPTRPTAGTRSTRRSQLLEDVYAYADYSYHGRGVGCEARTAVTPDTRKGYLISEFEGAQFPAKPFDDEPHRLAQALRYAAVLNDTIAQQGVAGSFGAGGVQCGFCGGKLCLTGSQLLRQSLRLCGGTQLLLYFVQLRFGGLQGGAGFFQRRRLPCGQGVQ